jgi:hypothetical protein
MTATITAAGTAATSSVRAAVGRWTEVRAALLPVRQATAEGCHRIGMTFDAPVLMMNPPVLSHVEPHQTEQLVALDCG